MTNIFEEMVKAHNSFKPYAVVTVLSSDTVATANPGKKMIQYKDGTIVGTIGGGAFEFECIRLIDGIIAKGRGIETINVSGVNLLVETYAPATTIVVVGGGHVGNAILKAAKLLPFATILVDDREEGLLKESIELADVFVNAGDNYEAAITSGKIPEGAYYFCGAWSHDYDAQAIKGALANKAKYIGMVGSHEKVQKIFSFLRSEGVPQEELDTVYTPVGLDIADGSPAEIAFAVMAEILMIKNNGTGDNCKGIKTKFLASNCESMVEPIGEDSRHA
ncbi:MAG: XdhC family protein [Clostridia bacterium]|nr:XdhC family protein [Clostridia bacterium]